ncbi:MAG: transcriptional regulator [Rhodobacteraceae bacterium]|nr:transcriptional regulator [Paracoccaceae bacterium]
MQTHRAKRVEIIIEAPMERRLADAIIAAGITGFTILPVLGGSGRSGRWSREGQVSSAGGMAAFVCIVRPERVDALLDAAFALLKSHIGVVSVTDCEVLRAERF